MWSPVPDSDGAAGRSWSKMGETSVNFHLKRISCPKTANRSSSRQDLSIL
jgi:hypothetical protein